MVGTQVHNQREKIMEREAVISQLKEKAEAVQSKVLEVNDMTDAFGYAVELTLKQKGASLAAPGLALQDRNALERLCSERGIAFLAENLRSRTGGIHTGFTLAEWGIAETATLIIPSSDEDTRIATMLSETHVAVVPRSRIYPSLEAIEEDLDGLMKTPQSYLAFISGASRTADIERVLAIGVHGPQELHILILEDRQ